MTTPGQPSEFDAGGGRLLGTNGLQQTIDRFDAAVGQLSSTVSNMSTTSAGGLVRSPAMSQNAEGATFSAGQFPPMGAWASHAADFGQPSAAGSPGGLVSAPRRGVRQTFGQTTTPASFGGVPAVQSSQPVLMNQTAAGGNGAVVQGTVIPGGGSTYQTWNTRQVGNGGVAAGGGTYYGGGGQQGGGSGGALGGGGAGGGTGPSPGGSGGGGGGGSGGAGGGFGGAAVQAGFQAAGWAISSGLGQLGNQQLFNAYGQQMAAQWGQGAQQSQNSAFGYYNSSVNGAAAGNAQSAAAEMGTLNQLTGGGAISMSSALGATNAFAFANQGLGASGAASLASQVYNPTGSLMMQMLTGVSAINSKTGQDNSLSSIIGGLAGKGYLGGGPVNSKTGTFSQSALNASFTAGRGTSYMNLQSLGYNQSQIQDIQSTMNEANNAALKGGTSFQNVMNMMNTAGGAPGVTEQQIQGADKQLAGMGVNLSTIQKQGNQASLGMAQQQGESSTYNRSISDFASAMTKATQAVNWFLDKTGIGKLIGGVTGAGAGYQSSGMAGVVGHIMGAFGGGAAAVSTTQQQGSPGRSAGSSVASVSPQVKTAVTDAEQQVGKPYVYGGSSPQTSFDCSGLVMWAYDQAGVKLPRTSEAQWSALRNRSVPLNAVREGDIVFSAGSDGSSSDPGHEALMISDRQIVEAPYTGANIRIRAFNPGEWQHAARPSGSVTTSTGGAGSAPVSTSAGSRLSAGNAGGAVSGGGGGDSSLGLTTDADATLFGGGGGGGSSPLPMTTTSNGAATSTSGGTSSTNGASSAKSFTGGGTAAQNQSLAKQMAASLYGWSGSQWTDGLLPLWTQESGFRTNAKNPQSGAYGIPQSLPASKMASAGSDYMTNPVTQLKWGLSYVKQRYGTPMDAEKHEKAYNWYGTGTSSAAPGYAVVGDRGPELVSLAGGEQIKNAAQTSSILRGTSAQPAQGPWTSTPAQQLMLDTLSPANNSSRSGAGGVTISIGDINVNAPNMTGNQTTSDTQVLGQLIVKQVQDALAQSNLIRNIAQGSTG